MHDQKEIRKLIDLEHWTVRLHKPVLVYRQQEDDFHVTRPNLCRFKNALGIIFQATADSHSTPRDHRHVCVSTDQGDTWQLAVKNADVNNYSLISMNNGTVVTMPSESRKICDDEKGFYGPRSELSWIDNRLVIKQDLCLVRMTKQLMRPLPDKFLSGGESIGRQDKPFGDIWGTIQVLKDGRWICPGSGCYADEARNPDDDPETPCRNMGIFHNYLLVSEDEGHTWNWHCDIASPDDIAGGTHEGTTETHFYEYDDRWRCIFRTNGLVYNKPLHYCDSFDFGHTWTKPESLSRHFYVSGFYDVSGDDTDHNEVIKNVDGQIDPRGLIMPDGTTVLTTGRPGSDIYLAKGSSTDFYKIDIVAHHNMCCPGNLLNTNSFNKRFPGNKNFFPNTGHTDVLLIDKNKLIFTYDRIPDGWRSAGSWKFRNTDFTAPDEIYTLIIEVISK